jgi:hypothetical protein
VQNFRNNIQSRESINNRQTRERYKDILYQYMNEPEHYVTIFTLGKDSACRYKNHPPVAGATAWAREPYLHAKKPIRASRRTSTCC